MSKFTKILTISPLTDGRSWVLRESFSYDIGFEGSDDTVVVPVGFVTDLASIPRIFWSFLPQWGRYGNAAVIHDWLYWQQDRGRLESDRIMFEAMSVLGVSFIVRWFIFINLLLFGWFGWWLNRKRREMGVVKSLSEDVITTVTRFDWYLPGFFAVLKFTLFGGNK